DPGPPASQAPFGAGTAADFHDSRHEYIAVAHREAFELKQGTVQFWFNAESTHGDQVIFAKDGKGLGAGQITIGLDGERIVVTLEDGAFGPDGPFGGIDSHTIRTAKIVDRHAWHHLAFTFGAGGMTLYLDGEAVGHDDFTGGLLGNEEALVIGGSNAWNYDGSVDLANLKITDSFEGRVDEVAIFGEALAPEQVRAIAAGGPAEVAAGNAGAGYGGGLADYAISASGAGLQIVDSRALGDGSDIVSGVEIVRFGDGAQGYVVGAGSANSGVLSAADVSALAGEGRVAVLGDGSAPLRLTGAWANLGVTPVGGT
ncbi:MAG: LamG domain-containing protein, partial [Alphaproteobacteria bacterium]